MKILITNSFQKDFEKHFSLHHFNSDDLIMLLRKTRLINLQFPYCKIKGFIKGIAVRGIVVERSDGLIMPLLFVLKSERYGDNLLLDKEIQKMISLRFEIYMSDFRVEKYTIH